MGGITIPPPITVTAGVRCTDWLTSGSQVSSCIMENLALPKACVLREEGREGVKLDTKPHLSLLSIENVLEKTLKMLTMKLKNNQQCLPRCSLMFFNGPCQREEIQVLGFYSTSQACSSAFAHVFCSSSFPSPLSN